MKSRVILLFTVYHKKRQGRQNQNKREILEEKEVCCQEKDVGSSEGLLRRTPVQISVYSKCLNCGGLEPVPLQATLVSYNSGGGTKHWELRSLQTLGIRYCHSLHLKP